MKYIRIRLYHPRMYHPAAYIGTEHNKIHYIIPPLYHPLYQPIYHVRGARGNICALRAAQIALIAGVAA